MPAFYRRSHRFVDARQQHDGDDRERRGKAEGRPGADPSDQQAASAGPLVKATVRASSIRALAAGSAREETSEGTSDGVATL